MQFGNAQYLYLLWLIPAAGVFLYYSFKKKRAVLERFSQKELLENLTAGVSIKKQKLKLYFIFFAVIFICVALLNPKWGYHWQEIKTKGIDIVIAIDVSKSMLAQDVSPDRLTMAKRDIESFVDVLRGDRVALVIFAGTSFIQCPLTSDYGAFKIFLEDVNVNSIPVGGTDIGGAVRQAVSAFVDKTAKHRIVILITDGEDHGEGMATAAKDAKKDGVIIYTVGIGNPIGAPIPIRDESGAAAFMKDNNGNVILTKVDEAGLKNMAFETGGAYVPVASGAIGIDKLYLDRIARMDKKEFESSRKRIYESRFQFPLFIAFILLLMEAFLGEKKRYNNP